MENAADVVLTDLFEILETSGSSEAMAMTHLCATYLPGIMPLVYWDRCPDDLADQLLVEWGHWLGGCNRPFGRQSWALWLNGQPVAVAVSASTVNARCGGYDRQEVVELARLCAHPGHRDMTRVALRLWRKTAAQAWAAAYWPVRAYVSYANALRHRGNIYRLDGWTKVADVPGGVAGGGWNRSKVYEPKSVWVYQVEGGKAAAPPRA